MFFFLSKAFWLVAQPISLVLILLFAGMALVMFRRRWLAISTLLLAFALLGLSGLTSIGYLLIRPLEDRFGVAEMPERVDTIIMLGGASITRISAARSTVALSDAGERMTTTLWLAQRFPEARIVLSGGRVSGEARESEAETAKRLLVGLGVDEEQLVLEGRSRNTIENVQYSRDLLGGDGAAIVLVTSAYHMPRSVGLFRAQGIDVIPWPTDYRSTGNEGLGFDLDDPSRNLDTTTTAIREWAGLLGYRLSGEIEDLFPGP